MCLFGKEPKYSIIGSKTKPITETRAAHLQNQAVISSPEAVLADINNPSSGGKHAAPKDFVCPITSNIFDDPVTLETGQTCERKAIQEWIDRGNYTFPITRQKLDGTHLPKTNYVLKRLMQAGENRTQLSSSPVRESTTRK